MVEKEASSSLKKHQFAAEIKELFDLLASSLYKDRDIFLKS